MPKRKREDVYDVKVIVRCSMKLICEIKDVLKKNPNREKLFRGTVFGPWLDILSHDNDNHLMHYVLNHQVYVSKVSSDCPPLIFHIGDNRLQFGRKEFCLITGFRFGKLSEKIKDSSPFYSRVFPEKITKRGLKRLKSLELLGILRNEEAWSGLSDMDAVRVCLLLVAELVFMGKEDRNLIPRHIVSLVDVLDSWNEYPWGEYMWNKFYKRTVNVVATHRADHLKKVAANPDYYPTYNLYGFPFAFKIWILESYPNCLKWWSKKENVIPRAIAWSNVSKFEKTDYDSLFGPDSIPTLELNPTPNEIEMTWFTTSIEFINGFVNEELKGTQEDTNVCDGSVGYDETGKCLELQNEITGNETTVGKNGMFMLDGGEGGLDSGVDDLNDASNKDKQPTLADVLEQVRALRKEVALNERRISKLERILIDKGMFGNDSPNGKPSCSTRLNNVERGFARMGIHTPVGHNDNFGSSKPDVQSDIPDGNVTPNSVNKTTTVVDGGIGSSKPDVQSDFENNTMDICMENGVVGMVIEKPDDQIVTPPVKKDEVAVPCILIDMADDRFDNPSAKEGEVSALEISDEQKTKCEGPLELASDGNNDGRYSEPNPSTLEVLVEGFNEEQNEHGLNVLQQDDHDRFTVPKQNFTPAVVNGVNPLDVIEFADDYLEDTEINANVSLDDMCFQEDQDKLVCSQSLKNEKPVDQVIDVQEVKSCNMSEYVNVVTSETKTSFGGLLGKIKTKSKKCGTIKSYLLRSAKDRKKRQALALFSVNQSEGSSTPLEPVVEEDVSVQPQIRSVAELLTLKEFKEDLGRPSNRKKDLVTIPADMSEFLKMEKPPCYRFPWGFSDILVDKEFWVVLACLGKVKNGWLKDSHLDLFIDLMWQFRQPDADWAMVGPYFFPCIQAGTMTEYFSNGKRYPVAWRDVEKVYFPVNEPRKHWCLAELHIKSGIVTFYDSLSYVSGNRRPWWRKMKRELPSNLRSYLIEHGILEANGIEVESYEITYKIPKVVQQEGDYGDCGIWVCIFLYRLSRNLPITFDDPLQTAVAYRERILEYFWTHRIEAPTCLFNIGTYQL